MFHYRSHSSAIPCECVPVLQVLIACFSQISAADTDTAFHSSVLRLEDMTLLAGCTGFSRSVEQKSVLVSALCHFVTIGRTGMAIEQ